MEEYSRHRASQSTGTRGSEVLQEPATIDKCFTQRMNNMEQQTFRLQQSCEHIIQKLASLDHHFTQSIGLIRKRLTLHDQYLEQNHIFFNLLEENVKLKYEIQRLETLMGDKPL